MMIIYYPLSRSGSSSRFSSSLASLWLSSGGGGERVGLSYGWQRRWRRWKGRQDRQAHLVSLYRNAPLFLPDFFASSFLFMIITLLQPFASVSVPHHRRVHDVKSQNQAWVVWNILPDCLMSVCFLVLLLLHLPHHLVLIQKQSSVNSSGVLSWISPRSGSSSPANPFPHIYNLFHDVLDWLHFKSWEVMHIWSQFSLAGIYYFRLDGLHRFFCNNNDIFNGVISPSRLSQCSIRVLF